MRPKGNTNMGKSSEFEKPFQAKGPEVSSELETKREILSMTIPSVEVLALIAPRKESKSRFPLPLDRNQWAPVLCEVARVNADTQYNLGVSRKYYPKGLVIDGSYMYTFEPDKTLSESQSTKNKIEERKYKPKVIIPNGKVVRTLFPDSRYIVGLLEDIHPMASGHLGEVLMSNTRDSQQDHFKTGRGLAEKTAGFIFQKLANRQAVGALTVSSIFGFPILKVHNPEDLHALQPHQAVELPTETQSFSYVVSRYTNSVVNKGTLSGFPLVVCLETCPDEVIRRQMYTQILFAAAVKPELVSPILITRDHKIGKSGTNPIEQFEEQLDEKLKNWWILKGVIEERQPVDWLADEDNENNKRFQRVHERELFFQRNGVHSELFMGDWLGMAYNDDEKKLTQEVKKGVLSLTATKLESGTQILGKIISLLPSIEYQLTIANYFSFFHLSNWSEAQALLADYEIETGGKFKKQFNIPPLKNYVVPGENKDDPQNLSDAELSSEGVDTIQS